MNEMEILELVRRLDGSDEPQHPKSAGHSEVVPQYLAGRYKKELAITQLGGMISSSGLVRGALLRAAMVDADECVRKRATLALYHASVEGLELLLDALAMDSEPMMRQLALECLNASNAQSKADIAHLLSTDPDPEVAELAVEIARGEPILYYQLEGPTR